MSVAWLQDLEEKVREASERLEELREENGRLRARVEELEARPAEDDGAAGWREERQEIEERVSKLAAHLEKLLEE